jgi:hypothetical protein
MNLSLLQLTELLLQSSRKWAVCRSGRGWQLLCHNKDAENELLAAHADSYAALTKQQEAFSLPLMPRLAVTFANHGKSNQKRFGCESPLRRTLRKKVPFKYRIGGRRRTRVWLKHAAAPVAKDSPNQAVFCDTLGSQYSLLWLWRAAGAC